MPAWNLRSTFWSLTPNVLRGVWSRLESSPVGERLLHGAFWALMGTVTSRVLGLAAAILAARIIGKVVYGELGIIQSTVGMLGTLAGFGMGTTASKFVAELRGKDPAKAGRIIALSSVVSWATSAALAAALVFLAPWLCEHTLAAPHLKGYLQISALLLLLSGINGAQIGALAGFEAFRRIARVSFLGGLLNFPLAIGGALLFGLPGIICGMTLAQAGGCLLNRDALRREAIRFRIPISYSSCMTEFPVIWRFSVPALLAQLLISIVDWAATAMLVRQPGGYGEMGAFSAANQWYSALMWMPYMFNSVTLPMLSERLGANDKASTVKLLKMSVKLNAAVALPLMALGCLLSPYIMASYGKGFASAWPTLIVVLTTAGLVSLLTPVGQVIAGSGRMWLGFFSNIGWAVVFLGTNTLLIKYGSVGLASARFLAYSAHAIFIIVFALIFIHAVKDADDLVTPQLVGALGVSAD